MRYVLLSVLIAILAGLCAACGTSPVEENVPYMILTKDGNFNLNVSGAAKNRGAQIILWNASDPNNPAPNDIWYFRKVRSNEYKIFSLHSDFCLDVRGGHYENDITIIQWTDLGDEAENQVWLIKKNNDGYSVTAKHSGKLLSAQGGDAQAGTALVQYDAVDAWANVQTWTFRKLQQ